MFSCDFCQTNYLNIYQTDLHEICRICRTLAVDKGSEVIFFDLSRDVAVAASLVDKIDLQSTACMTFARAAPPAYDKKGSRYAGRRQTNYLIRWTQASQLSNKLTIINRRLENSRAGYSQALPCIYLKSCYYSVKFYSFSGN